MKAKIKKINKDGIVRLETQGEIKEIRINEDILEKGNENVELCFRGKDSSGIIELNKDEAESLVNQINGRLNLIKDVKVFRE